MRQEEEFNPKRRMFEAPVIAPVFRIISIWSRNDGPRYEEEGPTIGQCRSKEDALEKIGRIIGEGNQMCGYGIIKVSVVPLVEPDHVAVETVARNVHAKLVARAKAEVARSEYQHQLSEYRRFMELKAEWDGKPAPEPPEE